MRTILMLVLALALASSVAGQESTAPPLESEPSDVKPVYVMQRGPGQELRGRLLQLGPETMTMLVEGQRRTVSLDDVLRVQVAGDSVKNGTVIGAIVMGVWGAVGWHLQRGSELALMTTLNAGFGALMGAGIDAGISGRTTIYSRPAPSANTVAGRKTGLAFCVRF
jgi:hypothetical protein